MIAASRTATGAPLHAAALNIIITSRQPSAASWIMTGDGSGPSGVLRIGGNIAPPTKIKDVPPVYPAAARNAGVQGLVILEAVLDETGHVRDVKVVRSVPLLDQAAVDAVKQWEYTPTLQNGAAIPVTMRVFVKFTLLRRRAKLVVALPASPPHDSEVQAVNLNCS
jgi:TonB family protein